MSCSSLFERCVAAKNNQEKNIYAAAQTYNYK